MSTVGRGARQLWRLPKLLAVRIKRLVRGVAFWAGISLPLLYIPMIVLGKGVQFVTFVGLVALNYLALFLGADHDRPADP